jgi:lipid A oxidase
MLSRAFAAGCIAVLIPTAANAEFQISIYGGGNIANNSDVTLKKGALSGTFGVEWLGGRTTNFKEPYYGIRGTYWMTDFGMPNWGAAVDFTHATVEADLDDPTVGSRFSTLEFTNGLNSLTLNALYRVPLNDRFSVYAGIGAGASIPHVEVKTIPYTTKTFEFQIGGPVVQGLIGGSYRLGYGFSVFGEYKATYSWNDTELVGGGSLDTDILVHHFAAGLSYSFGGQAFP